MTAKNTGGVAFVIAFDRAASDEHDAGFRVIGAAVGVLDGRAAEFRERNNDEIVPGGLVAVVEEIFPERENRPGNAPLQVRVRARQRTLGAVRIEPAHFGAGDDGVGLIQDERRCLQVIEETVGASIDDVLLGVVGMKRITAVLGVAGRKEVIGRVVVCVDIIHEGVARLREIELSEDRERIGQVLVLKTEQFPVFLVRERKGVGIGDALVRFRVAGRVVGNTQQVVTGRVG